MIGYNDQVYNINYAGTLKNIKISDKMIPTSGLNGVYCSNYVKGASVGMVKYSALFPWWYTDGINSDISPTGMFDSERYKEANQSKFTDGECKDITPPVACWIYSAYNPTNNTFNFDYSYPQVKAVLLPLTTGNDRITAESASSVGRTEFSVGYGFMGGEIIGISAASAPSVTALSLVTFLNTFASTTNALVPVVLKNVRVVKFQNGADLVLDAVSWSDIFAIQQSSEKTVTLNNININDLKLRLDRSGGKVILNYIANSQLGNVDVLEHNVWAQSPFTAGLTITSATITGNITIHSVQYTTLTPIKNTLELALPTGSNSTILIDGLLPDYTTIKDPVSPTMIDLTLTAAVGSGQNIISSVPASIIYSDSTPTTCRNHNIVLKAANATNSVSFACTNVMANSDNNEIQFPTSGTNNLSVPFAMVNGLSVNVSGQYKNLNSLTITGTPNVDVSIQLDNISTGINNVYLSGGITNGKSYTISPLPDKANINVGTATAQEVAECTGVYKGTGELNYNILGANPNADTTHAITTNGVSTLNISLNQKTGKTKSNTITVGDSGTTTKALLTLKIGGTATATTTVTTTLQFDTTAANAPTALKMIDASEANIDITTTLPTYVTTVNTSKVGGDSITTGAGTADKGLAITIPTQQTQSPRAQVTIQDNKTTTGVITIKGYDVEGTNKDTFQFVKATALHAVNVKAGSAAADSKLTAVTAATASLTKIFSASCDGNTAKPSSVTAGQFIQCTNVFNNTAPQLSDFSKLTFSTAGNTGGTNDLFLLVVYAQSTPVGGNTIHTGLLRYLSDTTDTLAAPKEFTEIGNFSDINDTNFDALTGTFSYV